MTESRPVDLTKLLRGMIKKGGETLWLFPALTGLGLFRFIRGDFAAAQTIGEQCLRLAEKVEDEDLFLTGHVLLGMVDFYRGQFTTAREHFDNVTVRYDRQKHRTIALRYANDPGVTALAFASMIAKCLGYPDQGRTLGNKAIALARELKHPFTLCLALGASEVYHQVVREWPMVLERAEEEITIASEYKFPFWLARARIMQGWALAEQGQTAEGIEGIRRGLDGWRATWARIAQPYFLAVLAEVYQKTGQITEGLDAVAAGLEAAHKIGELVWEADLYRLKGELMLQSRQVEDKSKTSPGQTHIPPAKPGAYLNGVKNKSEISNTQHPTPNTQAEAEAEACFLKALDIARQQQAKLVELRAATSLSRLWQHQGKHEAAWHLLAEIYNWFTEGFDTADLKTAKVVLDEIRSECR